MRNNVKKAILAVVCLLGAVSPVQAHGPFGGGFGLFGDFGGLGNLGHHGGFDWPGLAFSLGLFDPERVQDRFETRFDSLMMQYEDGVADIDDFFNSTQYDRIVNKTELLTDTYGLFVSGVERGIDRLGDFIGIANDSLTFYNDLLAYYQADDSLSPERLARLERWITRITDGIDTKIEFLTDKQTTLETNLPTYQAFQTEVDTFLDEIVAAGGGTPATASLLALASGSSASLAAKASGGSLEGSSAVALSTAAAVPEPSAVWLVIAAGATISMLRRRRV
jgi:hypothetical protein